MALKLSGRALHYVFKISTRKDTIDFLKGVLGMKILRHEEFSEGCDAACNGPYANRWSKTMVGYGPEDNNFVLELTYNYTVKKYDHGNDFVAIHIRSGDILKKARQLGCEIFDGKCLKMPDGYVFVIEEDSTAFSGNKITKLTLNCSNLTKTTQYWNGILGLQIFNQTKESVLVGFNEKEAFLEFKEIGRKIDHSEAYGRIAFSCPYNQQEQINNKIKEEKCTIIKPLISLDTPDKATVRVLILADPDGHEICFVDDENFRLLSQMDQEADKCLEKMILKYPD